MKLNFRIIFFQWKESTGIKWSDFLTSLARFIFALWNSPDCLTIITIFDLGYLKMNPTHNIVLISLLSKYCNNLHFVFWALKSFLHFRRRHGFKGFCRNLNYFTAILLKLWRNRHHIAVSCISTMTTLLKIFQLWTFMLMSIFQKICLHIWFFLYNFWKVYVFYLFFEMGHRSPVGP